MIRQLILKLAKLIGLRFAPDNHVIPVLRLDRFDRTVGPGYVWINPLLEEALPPLSLGLRVGNFVFGEVLSLDGIPFELHVTVLYKFNPDLPPKTVLAQVVRLPAKTLDNIVQDYASQGVRRLAAMHNAEMLYHADAVTRLERDLTGYLRTQLRVLGIEPLRTGGVLVKEMIAPPQFKQTMLNARQHETTLRVLGGYREHGLVDQAIRAQLVNGLDHNGGKVTLFSFLENNGMIPGWNWLTNGNNPRLYGTDPDLWPRRGGRDA